MLHFKQRTIIKRYLVTKHKVEVLKKSCFTIFFLKGVIKKQNLFKNKTILN